MIQFNENYINTKLRPTIRVLLTRMSQPVDADPKGAYLRKLLIPENLDARDREQFITDYFVGTQPADRAFTDEDEKQYRFYLLDELGTYIRQQIGLYGSPEKMKAVLLPSDDRNFETSPELTKALNMMIFRMVAKFEQKAVEEKTGEMSAEQKEKLENGELKFVEINGEEKIVDAGDLAAMAPDTAVVPMVEPGLTDKIMSGGSAQKAGPEKGPGKKKAAGAGVVQKSIRETQMEALKARLEAAGLAVLGMGMINNKINARIRDAAGQELLLEADMALADSDPRKMKFTFKDPVKDEGKTFGDRYFYVAPADLQNKFMPNGIKKPAQKVYEELPENAKFKGYEVPVLTGEPLAPPDIKGPVLETGAKKEETEEGKETEEEIPGTIPHDVIVPPPPGGKAAPHVEAGTAIPSLPKAGVRTARPIPKPVIPAGAKAPERPKTVREKKDELAARKSKGEKPEDPAARAARMQAAAMAMARAQAAAQQQQALQHQQQMAATKKRQQRRRMIWLALGAGGIIGAGPTAGILSAITAGTASQAAEAAKSVSFVLHCAGLSCLC